MKSTCTNQEKRAINANWNQNDIKTHHGQGKT